MKKILSFMLSFVIILSSVTALAAEQNIETVIKDTANYILEAVKETPTPTEESRPTENTETQEPIINQETNEEYLIEQGMEIDKNTGKDEYQTNPVPPGQPAPREPQDATISDEAFTCTLSVRCDTILQNITWLKEEKTQIVPNYGCSRYALKQGDKIEWLYTCDLGTDIGGGVWQKDE